MNSGYTALYTIAKKMWTTKNCIFLSKLCLNADLIFKIIMPILKSQHWFTELSTWEIMIGAPQEPFIIFLFQSSIYLLQ